MSQPAININTIDWHRAEQLLGEQQARAIITKLLTAAARHLQRADRWQRGDLFVDPAAVLWHLCKCQRAVELLVEHRLVRSVDDAIAAINQAGELLPPRSGGPSS